MGVRDWDSLGASPTMIPKWFCETVAEVMDAEAEEEDEIHPSKRQWRNEFLNTSRLRSNQRITILT